MARQAGDGGIGRKTEDRARSTRFACSGFGCAEDGGRETEDRVKALPRGWGLGRLRFGRNCDIFRGKWVGRVIWEVLARFGGSYFNPEALHRAAERLHRSAERLHRAVERLHRS